MMEMIKDDDGQRLKRGQRPGTSDGSGQSLLLPCSKSRKASPPDADPYISVID
jgi:hypothetical protein